MNKIILYFFLLSIFGACCKGDEIERIVFTDEQKSLIPYQHNQLQPMIHSEGYMFDLIASIDNYFVSDQEHCEDYRSFERYEVKLESTLPFLDIGLMLNRYPMNELDSILVGFEPANSLETINIGGEDYSVYKFEGNNNISAIYYSSFYGILKIDYDNGEYVQAVL